METPHRFFIPRRLALRWRIDFAGRRPVFGAWSSDVVTTFPYRGRPKILKVSIEASDLETGEVRCLASCPGYEWLGIRWKRTLALPIGQNKGGETVAGKGAIHGVQLVTQLEIATVYVDGKVQLEPNREWRKKV